MASLYVGISGALLLFYWLIFTKDFPGTLLWKYSGVLCIFFIASLKAFCMLFYYFHGNFRIFSGSFLDAILEVPSELILNCLLHFVRKHRSFTGSISRKFSEAHLKLSETSREGYSQLVVEIFWSISYSFSRMFSAFWKHSGASPRTCLKLLWKTKNWTRFVIFSENLKRLDSRIFSGKLL